MKNIKTNEKGKRCPALCTRKGMKNNREKEMKISQMLRKSRILPTKRHFLGISKRKDSVWSMRKRDAKKMMIYRNLKYRKFSKTKGRIKIHI